MVTLDVTHVFRVFKGPRGLIDVLDRHQPDHGLNYNQVQMWQQRSQIPARFVGAILYVVEREGRQCREFLVDAGEFASDKRPSSPGTKRARSGG
jgi:hypothetical protein